MVARLHKDANEISNDIGHDVRHVRLERKRSTQLSNEESLGWAVSYSDMLMVLMSFFVLFFSFEGKKKESLVSKIAFEIQGKAGSSGAGKGGSGTSAERGLVDGTFPKNSLRDIANYLQGKHVSFVSTANLDQLTVHLSDQIYDLRQFSINSRLEAELGKVLDVITPYKDKVQIIFIGHSDASQLSAPSPYLANNLDLSSLRASRALSFAQERGFGSQHLAIEAAGANMRNSRSLSIKIVPIELVR